MSNYIEYKGYFGSVEYSAEDGLLFGKVQFVDSLLAYDGTSVSEIETAFQETVDSYLQFCQKTGISPEKTFNGSFNVRTGPELHKKTAKAAFALGVSLNEFVIKSLERAVSGERRKAAENHVHITIRPSQTPAQLHNLIAGMNYPEWGNYSEQNCH